MYMNCVVRYMSYWGLILVSLCSMCQFMTSLYCYVKPHDIQSTCQTPLLFKVTWLLHNLSVTGSFFITTIYFSFVNEGKTDSELSPY